MTEVFSARVKRSLGSAWESISKRAMLLFELEDGMRLELTFDDSLAPQFCLDFQKLPGFIEDERKKQGLPVVQQTVIKRVAATEYGSDDFQQAVLIRTRFTDGTTQDTPIEKNALPELIRFMQAKLSEFDRGVEKHGTTH